MSRPTWPHALSRRAPWPVRGVALALVLVLAVACTPSPARGPAHPEAAPHATGPQAAEALLRQPWDPTSVDLVAAVLADAGVDVVAEVAHPR